MRLTKEGLTTKHLQRELGVRYKANMLKLRQGLPTELKWKREFHLSISPLDTHTHVIGEVCSPSL